MRRFAPWFYFTKSNSSIGVFQVFWIMQMAPNRVKRHIYVLALLMSVFINVLLKSVLFCHLSHLLEKIVIILDRMDRDTISAVFFGRLRDFKGLKWWGLKGNLKRMELPKMDND